MSASGSDFLPAAGTFAFLDGESAKTFEVEILDDVVFEGAESIHLSLRHPAARALG